MKYSDHHAGWRTRRRARIERVAAGGQLWARGRSTQPQLRRRSLTAGCLLALALGLAVATELRDGDGAEAPPQTAIRPEPPLPGGVVSDEGTSDEEFAEGGRGGAALVARRARERRNFRHHRREGSRSAYADGGSGRRGVAAALPLLTVPSRATPGPQGSTPARTRPPAALPFAVRRRVSGRQNPPGRRRARSSPSRPPVQPAQPAPPPPEPATPPDSMLPVARSKPGGKGHKKAGGHGNGHIRSDGKANSRGQGKGHDRGRGHGHERHGD